MFCNKCGAQLDGGGQFCPNCGAAVGVVPSPSYSASAPVASSEPKLARRLSLLVALWTIYGILEALRAAAFHFFAGMSRFGWWSGGDWSGWAGHWVWGWILGVAVLSAGLAFAAAFGLYERASWGRGVAIVAAIFALIHPLLGTILGVYTLVLMLSGDAAEQYNRLVRT
jgi:hypothetical protein